MGHQSIIILNLRKKLYIALPFEGGKEGGFIQTRCASTSSATVRQAQQPFDMIIGRQDNMINMMKFSNLFSLRSLRPPRLILTG